MKRAAWPEETVGGNRVTCFFTGARGTSLTHMRTWDKFTAHVDPPALPSFAFLLLVLFHHDLLPVTCCSTSRAATRNASGIPCGGECPFVLFRPAVVPVFSFLRPLGWS